MWTWLERVGYSADIAALRRDYPEIKLHGFETWARAQSFQ